MSEYIDIDNPWTEAKECIRCGGEGCETCNDTGEMTKEEIKEFIYYSKTDPKD